MPLPDQQITERDSVKLLMMKIYVSPRPTAEGSCNIYQPFHSTVGPGYSYLTSYSYLTVSKLDPSLIQEIKLNWS